VKSETRQRVRTAGKYPAGETGAQQSHGHGHRHGRARTRGREREHGAAHVERLREVRSNRIEAVAAIGVGRRDTGFQGGLGGQNSAGRCAENDGIRSGAGSDRLAGCHQGKAMRSRDVAGLIGLDAADLGNRQVRGLALARKYRRRSKITPRPGQQGAQLGHVVRASANDADAGHEGALSRFHAGVAGRRCRMKAASPLSEANASTPAARLSIFTP